MRFNQGLFQFCICVIFLLNCEDKAHHDAIINENQYITILGIAQDAGFPQIDCEQSCCQLYYENKESKKMVTCLGLIDKTTNEKWLFEATPDINQQNQNLKQHLDNNKLIDGIFISHAHIGHYTGLMQLGREALGGKQIPVYTMPKMKLFLEQNGPWNQLVALENITLKSITQDSLIRLNSNLKVTPFLVPHRDEYSETVGYKIEGPHKSALFIPDINKWHLWENDIVEEIKAVDYAFIDATFFREGEISRPMREVPHPFITETVGLFENESEQTKHKVNFIHFNHTNPAILKTHKLKDSIRALGFNFAEEGENFSL